MPNEEAISEEKPNLSDVREEQGDVLDSLILQILKDGRTVIGPGGAPIQIEATSADIKNAITRQKDLGLSRDAQEGGDASEVAKMLEERAKDGSRIRKMDIYEYNAEMPPVDNSNDAALAG